MSVDVASSSEKKTNTMIFDLNFYLLSVLNDFPYFHCGCNTKLRDIETKNEKKVFFFFCGKKMFSF